MKNDTFDEYKYYLKTKEFNPENTLNICYISANSDSRLAEIVFSNIKFLKIFYDIESDKIKQKEEFINVDLFINSLKPDVLCFKYNTANLFMIVDALRTGGYSIGFSDEEILLQNVHFSEITEIKKEESLENIYESRTT